MRLAKSDGLMALYETVVNSIHSTEDKTDKVIKVTIHRKGSLDSSNDGPISGFTVEDNGHGFTEDHFAHFQESDTTAKAARGGRGVGRFTWLRVFSRIEINSNYCENGSYYCRSFDFTLQGIDEKEKVDSHNHKLSTSVRLIEPRPQYEASLQATASQLALSLAKHILIYLISTDPPNIIISDPASDEPIILSDIINELGGKAVDQTHFKLDGRDFHITHLLTPGARTNAAHHIFFCAQSREVKTETLRNHIPNLSGAISIPGQTDSYTYSAYVTSKTLDECAEDNRRGFDFDSEALFSPTSVESISWDKLVDSSVEAIREHLSEVLLPLQNQKIAKYRAYIEDEAPHYRQLLKHHGKDIENLPPGLSFEQLDTELYRLEQKQDRETKAKINDTIIALSDIPNDATSIPDSLTSTLNDLIEEYSDSGASKLARHVTYRHAIINLLESSLGTDVDGKFVKEDIVHQILCPMKSSSEELTPDNMNLWLIDDKLFYHSFLASDIPFTQYKNEFNRNSPDRPDIAIFKRPMAFGLDGENSIQSVVLVEFKRPDRNDFSDTEKDNPIRQVLSYCKTLRSGEAHDRYGQLITIPNTVPFYAYIIADLTKSFRELAVDVHDFSEKPDQSGLFLFRDNLKCYIEIMDFRTLARDARRRHRVFFERLGLSTTFIAPSKKLVASSQD